MTKTGTADLMKCASKIKNTRLKRFALRKQCTIFLKKYPFVYLRGLKDHIFYQNWSDTSRRKEDRENRKKATPNPSCCNMPLSSIRRMVRHCYIAPISRSVQS